MGARYSLTRYGLSGETDIKGRLSIEDKLRLTAQVGGADLSRVFLPADTVKLSAETGVGLPSKLHAESALTVIADAETAVPCRFSAADGILTSAAIGKVMERAFLPTDGLVLSPRAGKNMERRHCAAGFLSMSSTVVKDFPRGYLATTGLYVTAGAIFLDEERIAIACTIPPGGVLRIDTENYTVTLDGENILHLQSGDWPKLARGLQQLLVASGTGGALAGSLTYQEAYL